jgi:hypothetical protein
LKNFSFQIGHFFLWYLPVASQEYRRILFSFFLLSYLGYSQIILAREEWVKFGYRSDCKVELLLQFCLVLATNSNPLSK